MVKCPKLGEKKCGRRCEMSYFRCEMSEGERTHARAKHRRFRIAITFDLRQILTSLKLWDNIADIFQYLIFQGNQNLGKVPIKFAKNVLAIETHYSTFLRPMPRSLDNLCTCSWITVWMGIGQENY